MKYSEMRMQALVKKLGWRRLVTSVDFLVSFPVALAFVLIVFGMGGSEEVIRSLSPSFMATSGALIAVALAGLAIIVSMSSPEFMKLLRDKGILSNMLMFYWVPAFSASLSIVANALAIVAAILTDCEWMLAVFLFFSAFLLAYSLLSVVLAVGTTVRFGLYRAELLASGLLAEDKVNQS